jgi:glutaredoxin
MSEVTLYTRPGCHLCEDARGDLEALAGELGFTVREVDIERDDALHARYLERIPVVAVGHEEVSDFAVDRAALEAALARVKL